MFRDLALYALILSLLILPDLSAQYGGKMPGSDPNRTGELYDQLLDKAGVRSRDKSSQSRPRNNDRYEKHDYQRKYRDDQDSNYDHQE